MIDHSVQGYEEKKCSLSSLKLTNLNIVSLMCMSRPPCIMSLLVARFHTSADLYWQLFWQKYTVLGSNFQVSAKTRHFYYQQPFPFPFRLKELFKVLSVFDDCLVNKTREGKKLHFSNKYALLHHICNTLTHLYFSNKYALL